MANEGRKPFRKPREPKEFDDQKMYQLIDELKRIAKNNEEEGK